MTAEPGSLLKTTSVVAKERARKSSTGPSVVDVAFISVGLTACATQHKLVSEENRRLLNFNNSHFNTFSHSGSDSVSQGVDGFKPPFCRRLIEDRISWTGGIGSYDIKSLWDHVSATSRQNLSVSIVSRAPSLRQLSHKYDRDRIQSRQLFFSFYYCLLHGYLV